MNALEQLRNLEAQRGKIIAGIHAAILALPDNPHIKRLAPNCFVLPSSRLGKNWSVEHHDFKLCYETISKRLSSSTAPIACLRKIITDGEVWRLNSDSPKASKDIPINRIGKRLHSNFGGSGKYRITLHDELVTNLKRLFFDLTGEQLAFCSEPNCPHPAAAVTGQPRCWYHWSVVLYGEKFANSIYGSFEQFDGISSPKEFKPK